MHYIIPTLMIIAAVVWFLVKASGNLNLTWLTDILMEPVRYKPSVYRIRKDKTSSDYYEIDKLSFGGLWWSPLIQWVECIGDRAVSFNSIEGCKTYIDKVLEVEHDEFKAAIESALFVPIIYP